MPVSLQIRNPQNLEQAILAGLGARPTIRMGISISGPAAAYCLVWEWGSARLSKPGPKTTWGVNPDGEITILTLTAPYGYIRVNRPEFRRIVREEITKIEWTGLRIRAVRARLEQAMEVAARRCAEIIAKTAPYDKGDLAEAIEIAKIGPETLDSLAVRPRLKP